MAKKPVALVIMDGYGLAPASAGNAISVDGSKNVNALLQKYPSSQLGASGMSVGLPEGQMGNSEVGHLNIGAGRVVYQELTRITKSIQDGDFFDNQAFLNAVAFVKNSGGKLHLMGLTSSGGVHSHNTHIYALVEFAKRQGLDNVYLHALMDGRDVSPTSGAGFLTDMQAKMDELNFGKIASVCGRYYAMDRDNNWDRVEKAYRMLTKGEGVQAQNAAVAVQESYAAGVTDEFILPTVIVENGAPVATIGNGDAVIFFNFRPDRARQITRAFAEDEFSGFAREKLNLKWICMTNYDATFKNVEIAFKPQSLTNTLGEYLASQNKKQLRIAETEKYAHVTFFFNGGVEAPNPNEERVLIPSPKVATYDLKPEMSAYEVTDRVIEEIAKDVYDVIILNFANCDMVGHTGVQSAAEKAVHTVDECVQRVVDEILSRGGHLFITADHGNADEMVAEDGSPFTAHTTNPVPFIAVGENFIGKTVENGILADIAPTLLASMGMEIPSEMTGKNLLR
jgi:2,3-bisphosphoglycerate-independent phosphoglycerate mutase